MSLPERGAAIHHLALRVADPERSSVFYAGLLGLPELRRFHEGGAIRSIWLRAGETVVMLERRLGGRGQEAGSGHLLAFAVPDLPAWEKRLAAAGVTVEERSAHTLYLRDPDGHRVGLSVFSFEPVRVENPADLEGARSAPGRVPPGD